MNLSIAVANYAIFKSLVEYEKLVLVNVETFELQKRKGWSRNSRDDLLKPIEKTFLIIISQQLFPRQEISQTLEHMRIVLSATYLNFVELDELISSLKQSNETKIIYLEGPGDDEYDSRSAIDEYYSSGCISSCISFRRWFSKLWAKIFQPSQQKTL